MAEVKAALGQVHDNLNRSRATAPPLSKPTRDRKHRSLFRYRPADWFDYCGRAGLGLRSDPQHERAAAGQPANRGPTYNFDGLHVLTEFLARWRARCICLEWARRRYRTYLRQADRENEPQRLTKSAAQESRLSWAADGRWIAFLRSLPGETQGVFLVPAIGGPERNVAEVYPVAALGLLNPGVSWHPSGKWLAVADRNSSADHPAICLLFH
jgi:hypothetical protein